MENSNQALMTMAETAGFLRLSKRRTHSLAKSGEMPCSFLIGRRRLVNRASLLKWLEEKQAIGNVEGNNTNAANAAKGR